MSKLIINGGEKLSGEVVITGAKNSALPLLAATLLVTNQSVIHNCPRLSDVGSACRILEFLGCDILSEDSSIIVSTESLCNFEVPDDLMHEMRSSIVFLGAMVARLGRARISFPGGCELGPRPIDLHLSALRQLGVVIKEEFGYLDCSAPNGLKGATINLIFPSVGATENIMLASVLARGQTIINNAAREPEIIDLAVFLNKCGARVYGAGGNSIIIEGVSKLDGCEHCVMPDRIVTSTYICCAAITNSNILIKNTCPYELNSVLTLFEQAGCGIRTSGDVIEVRGREKLLPIKRVSTQPYPGFPTDSQALVMAVCSVADGTSIFVENMFDARYKHVSELVKMGANITAQGKVAVVEGVEKLYGAKVSAMDLRGGASLVIAGLCAEGTTEIDDIYHIDRGYDKFEENLARLGANIKRM
jgi:UDP-N-acetylglucosamine 1-carboxyvinyltransferase